MGIYVTSDLHFNHSGVLKMSRGQFKTIEEHNDFIIERFNSVVGPDDLVYILGDLGFTPLEKLKPLVNRLNGRKVLILGNHDKGNVDEYRNMGFIDVYNRPVYYSKHIILSHEPVREALNNPYVFNVHGHLHGSKLDLPNYINVNVEETDYLPVSLNALEKNAQKRVKSRRENFGNEWYYEFYKFDKSRN